MARLLQREVAEILQNELYEASQSMVTVTDVRVTSDLGLADIRVSVLGENPGRRQIAHKRIVDLTPQIRSALAARIRHQVRRIPELRFHLDETAQQAARMEELFAKIRSERGDEPASDSDDQSTEE